MCGAHLRCGQGLDQGLHLVTRLNESVGWVVVVLAPLDVDRMLVSRPVMGAALVCGGFVKKLDGAITAYSDECDACSNEAEISALVDHGCSLV